MVGPAKMHKETLYRSKGCVYVFRNIDIDIVQQFRENEDVYLQAAVGCLMLTLEMGPLEKQYTLKHLSNPLF